MTNEEFKAANYKAIADMYKYEGAIVEGVHKIVGDMTIPNATETFEARINELFDLFGNDDTPIDQHLTAILAAQFFLNQCGSVIRHLDAYMKTIIEAAQKGENETLRSLVELKPDIEESLAEKNAVVSNTDLQKDLSTIIDSFTQLPGGLSKDAAQRICSYELHKVNYQSKGGTSIGGK